MQQVACLICRSTRHKPVLMLPPDGHRRLSAQTARVPVRFVACADCGHVYQTPRYSLDDLRTIYSDEYRKDTVEADGTPRAPYLAFARAKSRREFEWIAARLPADRGRGGRVLEIGCATGQLLRFFKDDGWEAMGIEPTPSFATWGSIEHGLPILSTLFEDADLEPGFDLIIFSQVVEHLQDPLSVLHRAASLLGPGGRLYVSVPYYETYLPIRPARELFISSHFYAFSPVSLANLAARCQFAVEAQGTMSRYLSVLLRPEPQAAQALAREDADAVRRRVWLLAARYFVLRDSRYLAAEWTKARLCQLLGERAGERAIDAVRQLKRRLNPHPAPRAEDTT